MQDALLTNRDLTGVLDFMRITGTGTVNLLDDKIDFDLKAAIVDGPKLQSDPAMVKYAGDTLPLRVTGTIDAPSVLPDFGAIVKSRVTKEVNQKLEEKKDEASDKIRDRLRGLLNR
ncbi:MAG TPA: hypothetical protein VFO94_13450 [Gammaproteobacteria bacterium]|nr:hypothetical protein [Gammaproteobacteria bacterium]